jgi:hypothetical protein
LTGLPTQVYAAEEEASGPKITGVAGLDLNTHFISYGYDVWQAGNDFGNRATVNPYAELKLDFDLLYVKVGTWWDVNSNATSGLGGQLQEVDVYYGVFVPVDKFTFGVTYQDWLYGGSVEKILDFTVSFDDSEYLGAFALRPSFTAHKLLGGGDVFNAAGTQVKDSGWAYVFGLAPGLTVLESEAWDLNLTFPVTVAFGDGSFYAEGGFAYFSSGVAASVPLKFIPAKYGAWSVGASLVYFVTNNDAIPTNKDDNFLTGKIGFSVGF